MRDSLSAPPDLERNENKARQWYVRMAKHVWDTCLSSGSNNLTYSTILKRVQLNRLPLKRSSTALLVDECQDLNPCKFDWLLRQAALRQTFFVGDLAQMINGFTGSSSKSVMNMEQNIQQIITGMFPETNGTPQKINLKDYRFYCQGTFTKSFRFGQNIADVANCILQAKMYSKQAACFKPYHLQGKCTRAHPECGQVTYVNLLHQTNADGTFHRVEGGLTCLAYTNGTIFAEALDLLHMDPTAKIMLNGKGANSGRNKYKQFRQLIPLFYKVFVGTSTSLPQLSDSWNGRNDLAWDELLDDVVDGALSKYSVPIQVIEKMGNKKETEYDSSSLKPLIELFMDEVVDGKVQHSDADVIFSTVHVCKGLEWDNVQLLDDFGDSFNGKFFSIGDRAQQDKSSTSFITASSQMSKERLEQESWEDPGFNWSKGITSQDQVNLMYVAVTRAKVCLAIPTGGDRAVGQMVRLFQSIENARKARLEWKSPPHGDGVYYDYEKEYEELASRTGRQILFYHPMLHQCEVIWRTMFLLPSGVDRLKLPDVDEVPETKEEF